ncbi:hypothetical protein ACFQ9Z_16355 [Streptomyces sp. NPDC056580]|uniref:hypothetical protein n=1 Tax=Streptomyces sp. NPDC056580 TaxID=3345872 RepID=UPI00369B5FFB
MPLVRPRAPDPTHGQTVRDIALTSADAILGIPLPHRRNPGIPGLTDSTEASRLPAELARAGWPATTLALRLDVTPLSSPRSATNAPASASTWRYAYAACTAT